MMVAVRVTFWPGDGAFAEAVRLVLVTALAMEKLSVFKLTRVKFGPPLTLIV